MKLTALLATPDIVTKTFPVVVPVGTDVLMLVSLQLVAVAVVPLNVTVLVPCAAPKSVPVIVIEVPTGPDDRLSLLITGEPTSTITGQGREGIPFATTTKLLAPPSIFIGTSKLVDTLAVPVATAIVLWSCVRA